MSSNFFYLGVDEQNKSSNRLLTGHPGPRKQFSNCENPIELKIQKDSLPVKKISQKKKKAVQNKIIQNSLNKPMFINNLEIQKPPELKIFKEKAPENPYSFKTNFHTNTMESNFEQIKAIDHDVLVASQKLRLSNSTLEVRQKSLDSLIQTGYAEIDELTNKLKTSKRDFKKKMMQLQQDNDDKLRKEREDFNQIISYTESQIERQIRWRKFEWLPETDVFVGQIDTLLDLIKYTKENLEKDSSDKIQTLGNVFSASLRTVESLKVRYTTLTTQFKKEIAELTKRINAVQGRSESIQNKNENMEKRILAYQEQREIEENELCDHLNFLYRELVETQQDRLSVAKQKRDIMKKMAEESANRLTQAKNRVQNLRNAIIPPDIEKNDFDELAAKARLRVAKIILRQMREENQHLKEDLELSRSISSSQCTQISSISSSSYI